WGLLVNISKEVFLPDLPKGNFEVYPYNTHSDCSPVGWGQQDLVKNFPIGTSVRIIAKEAKYTKSKLDNGNIRLETGAFNDGSISINDFDERLITSVISECNYKRYYRDHKELYGSLKNYFKIDPLLLSHIELLDFELRKDLLRLKNTDSEETKVNVLNRLIYYPYEFNYSKIVKMSINDENIIKQLIMKRDKYIRKNSNNVRY